MTNVRPLPRALAGSTMPERALRSMAITIIPPGAKPVPTLMYETLASAMAGFFFGLQDITVALLLIQGLAMISNGLTHGVRSEKSRMFYREFLHVWLVIFALAAAAQGKLLPVDPYPYLAGVLIARDMLVILTNASDSGLKTAALDRLLDIFRAKSQAAPPDDTKVIK